MKGYEIQCKNNEHGYELPNNKSKRIVRWSG